MVKTAIVIIKLGFYAVTPNGGKATVNAPSGMTVSSQPSGYTVRFGHTPHSVHARNGWDTLRLTPNGEGVTPAPVSKGHL